MLFHTTYDLSKLNSGSRVRPYYMMQAFRDLGYQVTEISGNSENRRKRISSLGARERSRYQFCYSEPSTYPLHPIWDYLFYWRLCRAKVPIGVFYRDAYWKLAPEWVNLKGVRKWIVGARYRSDLRIYNRFVKAIFFPSQTLADHFHFDTRKHVLWPAAQKVDDPARPSSIPKRPYSVIYVGNVTSRYGLDILLKSMRYLNEWKHVILNLVCPQSSLQIQSDIMSSYRNVSWLNIYHLHGKELEPIYKSSSLGIVPLHRNLYNDLAMPVKLFEYISHGLPVVVTNCTEMAQFVKQTGIGRVAQDNAESLAEHIKALLSNVDLYLSSSLAARNTVEQGHCWIDRALKVKEILLDEKNI